MVQTNKILTVSYGTFSCTLEGFDESFETMKAIAEYFRDLAADDRYFGAEPPTPDAEMLARIAEREISRRVEAHSGDEGIVLRPSLADASKAAPMETVETPVADAETDPVSDTLEDLSDLDLDTPSLDDEPAPEAALEEAALALSDEVSDVTEAVEASVEESDNSIADKLRRIRDVVGTQDVLSTSDEAEDASDTDDTDVDASKTDKVEIDAESVQDEGDSTALLDNVMATLGSEEAVDQLDAAEAKAEDILEDLRAEVEPEEVREEVQSRVSEADASPAAPVRVAPRRPVRVVKVKRRAVDAAVKAGQLVQEEDPASNSSLSAADEADLQRELAQLEEEIEGPKTHLLGDEHADAEEAFAEDAARAARSMARRDRLEGFGEDDTDMSRLMAETDEQLKEPEGRSRRNAIAHLRAAVAATRADRGDMGAGASDPREAYRDDLAQAVRPRRNPGTDGAPARVAPLKLVAEQRVDVTAPAENDTARSTAAKAVRPRRISTADMEDGHEETGSGFAAFAEERGAHRLPDLLEAAAAYMSFVEGRDRFSRPQLMNKLRQVQDIDSSREDRLRSFGQLLREGKIEKVEGGRFTASDSIGFKPNARAAG